MQNGNKVFPLTHGILTQLFLIISLVKRVIVVCDPRAVGCRIVHIPDDLFYLSGGHCIVTILLHHNRVVGVSVQAIHLLFHIHHLMGRGGGGGGKVSSLRRCAAPA